MKHRRKTLPWNTDAYLPLAPGDLDPTPLTPERRIRIAAALATMMRDERMIDGPQVVSAEVIRAVLTMTDEAWARDCSQLQGFVKYYDPVDPKVRFEQTRQRHLS